jgi:hypothetical protein
VKELDNFVFKSKKMKKTLTLLCLLLSKPLFAQNCNIDYSQNQVGLYPSQLPVGTVGSTYNEDITFVLPTDTLGYDFLNFQIVSVNLPIGLSWTCNNNLNNCNYNPQTSPYGCVNINGIPLLAGAYTIEVNVLADLSIINGYPILFELELQILPASNSGTNNSFSYQLNQPCAPALATFINQEPGLAFYSWEFGNGAGSNAENPSPQYYPNAGNYPITYMAYAQMDTALHIELTEFNLQNMSNYGENFPSFEEADPYFKVKKNGQVIYQSAVVIDQNPPLTWWPNLNLELGQNYTLEIWEADQSIGENYFGADDYIGNHSLNIGSCNGCYAGSAQIAYQITMTNINPIPSFQDTATLTLFESPLVPILQNDSTLQQLLAINTSSYLQWYWNGGPLLGQNNNSLNVQESGYYHVLSINQHGCAQSSDTLFINVDFAAINDDNSASASFHLTIDQLTKQLSIELEPELVGAQIELWQIDGRLIDAWKSVQTIENYPIDLLSGGIYLVKLSKGNVVIESKISIVH